MRAAVLADHYLYTDGGEPQSVNTAELKTVVDLLNLAERFNRAQVWLLPGSDLLARLCRNHKRLFRVDDAQGWKYAPSDELKTLLSGWRDNSRRQIIFPGALDVQWELETITEPRALLRAVAWMVTHTGVYPSIPTRTARKMVEASLSKPLAKCESDLNIFAENKAPELDYMRRPGAAELGRAHVYGFDKNYMFLSACAIHLGDGNYTTRAGMPFDETLPGIWRASITGGRADVRDLIKLRGCEDAEEAGRFWYYTPALALARECGAEIQVDVAHVWPSTRKVLDAFAGKMRAGVQRRAELRGAELKAANSLKNSYTHFIGWLARNNGANGQPFWRPDWRSLVVDTAYQRLIRNVIKIADAGGPLPFAIHRDCLLYFSDETDARALLAPLAGAGAIYKHVFTAPARDVAEMLAGDCSAATLAVELKRRWKGARRDGSKRRRKAA